MHNKRRDYQLFPKTRFSIPFRTSQDMECKLIAYHYQHFIRTAARNAPFFTAETRQLHIEQATNLALNFTKTHWEQLSLSAWWRTEYKPDGYLLFHPTFQNALEGRCYLLGFSQFNLTPSISLGLYSCPRHFNKQTKSHLSCKTTWSVWLFLSSCEVLKGCSYAN